MDKDVALIVFVKNLIPGKVKTRLAATIGVEAALGVYQGLVVHVINLAMSLPFQGYIYYSEFIPDNARNGDLLKREVQYGDNLGSRMDHALRKTLELHNKVILIGSDCPDLTSQLLDEAVAALTYVDLVIGPASDGGYYLIGMSRPHSGLFLDIDWSTSRVFEQTRERLLSSGISFKVLEVKSDIDTFDDLQSSGWKY